MGRQRCNPFELSVGKVNTVLVELKWVLLANTCVQRLSLLETNRKKVFVYDVKAESGAHVCSNYGRPVSYTRSDKSLGCFAGSVSIDRFDSVKVFCSRRLDHVSNLRLLFLSCLTACFSVVHDQSRCAVVLLSASRSRPPKAEKSSTW